MAHVDTGGTALRERPHAWRAGHALRSGWAWAAGGVVVYLAAVAGLAAAVARAPGRVWTDEDLNVYRAYGRAVWHGWSLYRVVPGTRMPFSYPPFAALVLAPLASLPALAAAAVMAGLSLVALLVALWRLAGSWAAGPVRLGVAAALAGWAMWCEPVQAGLFLGQVHLLLLLLVVLDVTAGPHGRWAGVGVGLATAVKVTPGLFVVYFLITGQRRRAARAAVAWLVTVVLAAAVLPADSLRYWSRGVLDTAPIARVASPAFVSNQSLHALIVRTVRRDGGPLVTGLWLLAALAAVGVVLGIARAAHGCGDELLAAACVGLGALLISPVSWTHHWVWLVVALPAITASRLRTERRSSRRGRPWRVAVTVAAAVAAALVIAAWPGVKQGTAQPTGLLWAQPWSSDPSGGRPEYRWSLLQWISGDAYLWLAGVLLAAAWVTSRASLRRVQDAATSLPAMDIGPDERVGTVARSGDPTGAARR